MAGLTLSQNGSLLAPFEALNQVHSTIAVTVAVTVAVNAVDVVDVVIQSGNKRVMCTP